MDFQHIPSGSNAADILSKHWAYSTTRCGTNSGQFCSGKETQLTCSTQEQIRGKIRHANAIRGVSNLHLYCMCNGWFNV